VTTAAPSLSEPEAFVNEVAARVVKASTPQRHESRARLLAPPFFRIAGGIPRFCR